MASKVFAVLAVGAFHGGVAVELTVVWGGPGSHSDTVDEYRERRGDLASDLSRQRFKVEARLLLK